MSTALWDGKGFKRRVIGVSYVVSMPALAIMIAALHALMELSSEQWGWFLKFTLVYAVVISPITAALQGRFMAPVCRFLDARRERETTVEERKEAFAAVMVLPIRAGVMGCVSWIVPVFLVSIAMDVAPGVWTAQHWSVMMGGGVAAGFVFGSFHLFGVKRVVERTRNQVAAELPDPALRSELVVRTSIRAKLLITVAGVSIVPVLFAVLLSHTRMVRSVEWLANEWQHAALAKIAPDYEQRGPDALASPSVPLPGQPHLEVFEPGAGSGPLAPHLAARIAAELAAGETTGDSRDAATDLVYAWQRIGEGRVLLLRTTAAALRADGRFLSGAFPVLLVCAAVVALSLAFLLAEDISRATRSLRGEAERMSGGDLRGGRVFESEDELGELSRSFEGMGASLRETVLRVSEAADRVEGTARELSRVSGDVSSVTESQVSGIAQASHSMESINLQVKGIAESSSALNVSVEESSSTILELGAAGEELNETASVLSSRVDEVSTSIEQMVRSVRQVSENTEALSEASLETSTSMEEMATSMREVDTVAAEAASLSQQMVGVSERGQEKVRQTIAGMEAIREATETAESVIRSLGARTGEIGAIVDVIDDVADETNLLALNAAIIAAQAGEHGRAFSVVADEIKDLADRVLASTKEIGGLIRAVQEESNNAIGAIEKGTHSVASGVDLTAEAGVSLEEITRASRESGQRIAGIVSAVREQARAASHVVELMERVRRGVEEIRSAASEQDRGNDVVYRGSVAMRDVAAQVRGTTEEQARGSGRIRESIEGVREAVEQINAALQEQSASCRSAVEFLEAMHTRTRQGEQSAQRLDQVAKGLVHQAEALRHDVGRFQI